MKKCSIFKRKSKVTEIPVEPIFSTDSFNPEILPALVQSVDKREYNVAGCVHPLRPEMTAAGKVPVGTTIADAISAACTSAGVRKRHIKFGVAQIGIFDPELKARVWTPIVQQSWKRRRLKEGELLRFRLLPRGGGGGGGGKNPLRAILQIVVAVVAVVTTALTMGTLGPAWAGLLGLAITTVGMVLVNAIAPVKPPSFKGLDRQSRAAESQVYGVSAGRNSINQWGRVPVPLGQGRYAPPKAASAYTQTIGEDQYLHELLCLGIGDLDISDIKIGVTPISEYADVVYEIIKYDPVLGFISSGPSAGAPIRFGGKQFIRNLGFMEYETANVCVHPTLGIELVGPTIPSGYIGIATILLVKPAADIQPPPFTPEKENYEVTGFGVTIKVDEEWVGSPGDRWKKFTATITVASGTLKPKKVDTGKISLYPTGVFQEDLNIQLKNSYGWSSKRTAECEKIEIDFAFQGLGRFNDAGGIDWTSVSFLIQYKKKDSVEWSEIGIKKYHGGTSQSVARSGVAAIGVHETKGIGIFWGMDSPPEDWVSLRRIRASRSTWTESVYDYEKERYVSVTKESTSIVYLDTLPTAANNSHNIEGFSVSTGNSYWGTEKYEESHISDNGWATEIRTRPVYIDASISVSGGYITKKSSSVASLSVVYSGAQSRLMRRTFVIGPIERGEYDVRILRETGDSSEDRLRNDSYWTALRSITNDPPVNTSYPVNLLAMRIRATGQLSGSVDTLTLHYKAKTWDWDKETQGWIHRYTSNPASIFRHMLQDRYALARPQSDDMIDFQSIQEAHEFWSEKGWTYNIICDSTASVFERLQSVCAAGLASPTMNDGKWAIIVDKPRDMVKGAFTSANSWGWSFKRTQVRLPQEIHCTFIDQDIWDTNMRVVATDEPLNETGDRIYETQTYEGVNNSAQVYQLARFHYADAKVRRRTISLRCLDSAIGVSRGDLVDCACPNVSPQGLQTGRVRKVTRDVNDNVLYFMTDQTQTTDFSGRRFGVKIQAQSGAMLHAEIKSENRTQRKLTLNTPQPMDINEGDQYAFGDYTEEMFSCIVLGMKPNQDMTWDLVLQDYAPQLYGDLSKPIPPFQSIITNPIEAKGQIQSTPIIVSYASDESVLIKQGSTSVPRLLVSYSHPSDLDENAKLMQAHISIAGENKWKTIGGSIALDTSEIYVNDVVEKGYYDFRIRYVGHAGETGPYAYLKNAYIIGRATRPPNPNGVYLDGYKLTIIQNGRPLDVVGHEIWMAFDEKDDFGMARKISNPYTVTNTFDLTPYAGRARRVFVRTIDELGLTSDYVTLAINLGDLMPANVILEISEEKSWWQGNLELGNIIDDDLYAVTDAALWPEDGQFLWPPDDQYLWPSGVGEAMRYTYKIEIPEYAAGARIFVRTEQINGTIALIEYRRAIVPPLWPEDANYLWPLDNDFLWPTEFWPDWAVMPDDYRAMGFERLEIRVTFASGDPAIVEDIVTVFDVEDKELVFEDIEISGQGTRLTIPPKFFRRITNVIGSVQYVEGSQAVSMLVMSKNGAKDKNGYLIEGPLLTGLSENGMHVSASVDVRIKGY